MSKEYTIETTKDFSHQLETICKDSRLDESQLSRIDDIKLGVQWALQKNPNRFEVIPKTKNLRRVDTIRVNGIPMLRILFKIDEEKKVVILLFVQTLDLYL